MPMRASPRPWSRSCSRSATSRSTWYEVLLHLSEAGGRLRMAELSEGLLVNKSSLSRLCDRMEAAELVRRETVPEDARGVYAVLTKQGREVLRRAAPTHLRGVYDHFATYPDRHRRDGARSGSSPSCRAALAR